MTKAKNQSKTFGVQLLLLVAVAGGATTWRASGYFNDEVAAHNAGAKAVNTGKAFARRLVQA